MIVSSLLFFVALLLLGLIERLRRLRKHGPSVRLRERGPPALFSYHISYQSNKAAHLQMQPRLNEDTGIREGRRGGGKGAQTQQTNTFRRAALPPMYPPLYTIGLNPPTCHQLLSRHAPPTRCPEYPNPAPHPPFAWPCFSVSPMYTLFRFDVRPNPQSLSNHPSPDSSTGFGSEARNRASPFKQGRPDVASQTPIAATRHRCRDHGRCRQPAKGRGAPSCAARLELLLLEVALEDEAVGVVGVGWSGVGWREHPVHIYHTTQTTEPTTTHTGTLTA